MGPGPGHGAVPTLRATELPIRYCPSQSSPLQRAGRPYSCIPAGPAAWSVAPGTRRRGWMPLAAPTHRAIVPRLFTRSAWGGGGGERVWESFMLLSKVGFPPWPHPGLGSSHPRAQDRWHACAHESCQAWAMHACATCPRMGGQYRKHAWPKLGAPMRVQEAILRSGASCPGCMRAESQGKHGVVHAG